MAYRLCCAIDVQVIYDAARELRFRKHKIGNSTRATETYNGNAAMRGVNSHIGQRVEPGAQEKYIR